MSSSAEHTDDDTSFRTPTETPSNANTGSFTFGGLIRSLGLGNESAEAASGSAASTHSTSRPPSSPSSRKISFANREREISLPRPLSQSELQTRRSRQSSAGNEDGTSSSSMFSLPSLPPILNLNLSSLFGFGNSKAANAAFESEGSHAIRWTDDTTESDHPMDGSELTSESNGSKELSNDLRLELIRSHVEVGDESSVKLMQPNHHPHQPNNHWYSPIPSPSIEKQQRSPLAKSTKLSRRPSESPASPTFKRAESTTSLDTITLHSIAREGGEGNALRAVSQRQIRDTNLQYAHHIQSQNLSYTYSPKRADYPQNVQRPRVNTRSTLSSDASFPILPQTSPDPNVSTTTSPITMASDASPFSTTGLADSTPVDQSLSQSPEQEKVELLRPKQALEGPPRRADSPSVQISSPKMPFVEANKQQENASPLRRASILRRFGLSTPKMSRERSGSTASRTSTLSVSSAPLSSPGTTISTVDSSGYLDLKNGRRYSVSSVTSSEAGDGSQSGIRLKPRFVKSKAKNKLSREFGHLFLSQELHFESHTPVPSQRSSPTEPMSVSAQSPEEETAKTPTSAQSVSPSRFKKPAVWAMEMSPCGTYLAAAGHDGVIRVWKVVTQIDTHNEDAADETRQRTKRESSLSTSTNSHCVFPSSSGKNGSSPEKKKGFLEIPVFESQAYREYSGHRADVLDLSWSKNNFLLSSSMDKTVRLWHLSREECLCTFLHSDFVTSVAFHPKDDRYFISGSLDCRLRLWSIPDRSLRAWSELPHLITAVCFPPSGNVAIAGTYTGHVAAFDTETLHYRTSFEAKSTRGKNAKGRKVTGLKTLCRPGGKPRLLVTSNDSRIRMFNCQDSALEAKYSGHENVSSQIRASFSDDGEYIISGSEDGSVYIWNSGYTDGEPTAPWLLAKKAKMVQEWFPAESSITTCAIFAPERTKQLLRAVGDPLLPAEEGTSHPNAQAQTQNSTALNAIIICADDNSGKIRIYRNSPLPELPRHNSTLSKSALGQSHKATPTRRPS